MWQDGTCVLCRERHVHRRIILDELRSGTTAGGQQAEESGVIDMALFLNISVSYVRQLKKQGMPMVYEEAKLWKSRKRVAISKPPQVFIQQFADFSEMLRKYRRTVIEVGDNLQKCFESSFCLHIDNICGRLSKNIFTIQTTLSAIGLMNNDDDDDEP
jgi:hypothetical protein